MRLIFFFFAAVSLVGTSHAQSLQLKAHLETIEEFISSNCLDCHSSNEPTAGLDLENLDISTEIFQEPNYDTAVWEQIHRRTHARQMPPPEYVKPDENSYLEFVSTLEKLLGEYSVRYPRPGRIGKLRRLTRNEYQNAIRDLLAIEIDGKELLPKDESSHGFDNITVEDLSTTRMTRYISAAQKISKVAVGLVTTGGNSRTVRLPADRSQEEHVEGLPFGTRGGTVFQHYFPKTGQYEFSIRLTRDRDEKVEGLNRKHHIDLLIDRGRKHRFEVVPPPFEEGKWDERDFTHSDSHLNVRVQVDAGQRSVGVTFPKTFSSIVVNKRQPFQASFNRHRHPRKTPAIYQVSIVGPFEAESFVDSVSRQKLFANVVVEKGKESQAAEVILGRIARKAYRRPIEPDDLNEPMKFFQTGFNKGGFDSGIELALTSILSNPFFLFKVEVPRKHDQKISLISDFELASRLSFFLWSSIPDEELLMLAERNELQDEDKLRLQVERMLKDPRSDSLVNNFASQWLYLRNLEAITPDMRRFPNFDDNLRQSFRSETEQLFREIIKNDLSVLKLIDCDHTWLNERLAAHYDIAGVRGDHFRRVELPANSRRGGILRHGSILMVTSYATRTSPTIRGNWILENILGTPAPPPPPDVPNLKENKLLEAKTLRERLAQHREDVACAGCHNLMDPVGFSLENFDAVGRWRDFSKFSKIDSTGLLPDGTDVNNVGELEEGILKRPKVFVQTMTEKLMTFGLGRTLEPFDGPAVRKIVNEAEKDKFRFSAVVKGIVTSMPFRYRKD